MAGSYNHATNERGELLSPDLMREGATETQGDAFETIEELYGMVWFLAGGDPAKVEDARRNYQAGLALSPGVAEDDG